MRSEEPHRRLDVLPVTLWQPSDDIIHDEPEPGGRLWVTGSVQRRFWSADEGRRSRIEVVAEHVALGKPGEARAVLE